MTHKKLAIALVAAFAGALCCTDAGAHGAMGASARGFAHFGGFHRHPWPANHFRFPLRRRPFAAFRFGRFPETGEMVAGDDYTDDYDDAYSDGDLADMHFRVDESFGPWDVPTRPMMREPTDTGPWDAARMDPWHGYEPDSW